MKFFDRLKIWGKKQGEKAFKVSEYDKAKAQYDKLKETIDEFNINYCQAKGEKAATEGKIEKLEGLLDKYNKAMKERAAKGEKDKAELIFNKRIEIETNLKEARATLVLQEKVVDQLEGKIKNAKKMLTRVQGTLSAIKAKERYATNVDKYAEILKNTTSDGNTFDEIEYEVDVKFNAAEAKLDMIDDTNVEDLIDDTNSDFEEYYKSLVEGTDVENKDVNEDK